MSLFHKHEPNEGDPGDEGGSADAASYEVLEADGKVVRYARDAFDEIFETTDPDEVQRQVAHGWAILAQRDVESGGRGPSGDDLIVGIEGLRVGGMLGYQRGETVTWYTLGYLKDGARGEPVE
jgi:YD repeat-containing protein